MNESPDFPTATIVPKAGTGHSGTGHSGTRLSKWWWLTLGCLLLAVGLGWVSQRSPGIPITITFDQGHGLKVGDTIRHRGIDVGIVDAVDLTSDLSGIQVGVNLSNEGRAIAVSDSRFWIVRPRITMDKVSGLETAIGSKYIRVVPGKSRTPKREFQGLPSEPADSDDLAGGQSSPGLELLLRSHRRKGIYTSAPLTYRGFQVGKVLSVGLSPNAEFVDVRVRIDEPYRKLVRQSSVFWITSGFEVDIGMTGVTVNAESLATIAKGGITFITTSARADDTDLVSPGHAFALSEEYDKQWLEQSSSVNLLSVLPVPVLGIRSTWQSSFLGIARAQSDHAVAVIVRGDHGLTLLAPTDIFARHADTDSEGFATKLVSPKDSVGVPLAIKKIKDAMGSSPAKLAMIPLDMTFATAFPITRERIRSLVVAEPEDCFVSYSGSSKTAMPMIARQSISAGEDCWNLNGTPFSRQPWHGSPVIAASDISVYLES